MMWLVQVALRRPLSVAVMAALMLVLGALSFAYMKVDVFPVIDLPVVMMVWTYPGLSAYDMERRMVTISERARYQPQSTGSSISSRNPYKASAS